MNYIKSINHITINTVDIEKSLWFYKKILGLPKLDYIDMDDHKLFYFDLGNGIRLELIEYQHKIAFANQHQQVGAYRHICFETDNMYELTSKLTENDISIIKQPSFVEKLGYYTMLIQDPNLVEIEFFSKTLKGK